MADTGPITLSLFSGVGGLDLGWTAATGGRVVGYAERDAYAAATLLARMEEQALEPAPVWCGDITELPLAPFHGVDAIIGGFPCQDISAAGAGAGIDGERSGLWGRAFVPAIRELRPRYVFVENVSALLTRGLDAVLGDLAALGYDTQWASLRASAVGAPHRRERIFILAYARRGRDELGHGGRRGDGGAPGEGEGDQQRGQRVWRDVGSGSRALAAADIDRLEGERGGGVLDREREARRHDAHGCGGAPADVDDAARDGRSEGRTESTGLVRRPDAAKPDGAMGSARLEGRGPCQPAGRLFPPAPGDRNAWTAILAERPFLAPAVEPGLRVLVDGAPVVVDKGRVDALRCAGNGVVPFQAAVAARLLLRRMTNQKKSRPRGEVA